MSSSRNLMFIALVCVIPAVYTYSDGAPEGACDNMIPQHGIEPQASAAPYKIFLSSKQLDSTKNQQVNIKIQGNGAGKSICATSSIVNRLFPVISLNRSSYFCDLLVVQVIQLKD